MLIILKRSWRQYVGKRDQQPNHDLVVIAICIVEDAENVDQNYYIQELLSIMGVLRKNQIFYSSRDSYFGGIHRNR